jgi:hypothetical protein
VEEKEVKLKKIDVVESGGKFYIIAKLEAAFEIQMSLASPFVTRENAERFLRWFRGEILVGADKGGPDGNYTVKTAGHMEGDNRLRRKDGRPPVMAGSPCRQKNSDQ